jgi:hypothetical protein
LLTDQQLPIHCQGLYARLWNGYAKCEAAPDPATKTRWENAWEYDVLPQYQRAVDELRSRGMGE